KITLLDANKKEIETNHEMKYLLPQSRYHFNFKKNISVVDFGKYKLLVQTDKQDQPLEFNLKE
ncbi:molecular chaperone, partial [Acinetobacter nosocomialis]|nr:molecular chaperone [Acinetobacter nosocomialis]